jgi:hypothetical protein
MAKTSPPRCGKILRVDKHSFSQLVDGDYPCTLPADHKPADEHRAVVAWSEAKQRRTDG